MTAEQCLNQLHHRVRSVWTTLELISKVAYKVVNASKHDQKDIDGRLLLDLKSSNDKNQC
jgi:hypothetical protein